MPGVLPHGLRVAGYWSAALLLVAVSVYLAAVVLARIWVVSVAAVAALLLTALFRPLHDALRRIRFPDALAAISTLVAFLTILAFAIGIIWERAAAQLDSLRSNLAAGLEAIRDWLVQGPLSLRPEQVDRLVTELTDVVWSGSGSAGTLVVGARMAVEVLSGVVLALFLMFFLLKDGYRMWRWGLGLVPEPRRETADHAGQRAWHAISGYVRGTTAVAMADAVLIAIALAVLRVPLVLPLALLTFFGAFVPIVGATVAGAAAVLVALVTRGLVPALLVFGAVIFVQQVEGNVLQPWIMRRAVHLHPVPVVLAIAIGSLVAGIAGAVVAVPLLAVTYHVGDYLLATRNRDERRDDEPEADPPARAEASPGVDHDFPRRSRGVGSSSGSATAGWTPRANRSPLGRDHAMTTLTGRTILMSGGSRGIGLAIALRAARDGAAVALLAKTAEPHPKLEGTVYTAAEEIRAAGGKALAIVGDVRDDDQVAEAVARTVAEFGGIDIVINNASAIDLSGTETLSMKRYDLMQDINCRGTFLLSKTAIPHLRRSSNAHILTLSPPLNLNPRWAGAHLGYTIAKYGMSLTTIGLAEEFRKDGIAVNSLWPRTTIATAAVRNLLGGESMIARSRTAEIMADAAHVILTRPPSEATGNFYLDDEVLASAGFQDLSRYAVGDPSAELQLDLFLDPPDLSAR